MSGGGLTDHCHNLFYLEEWSERIERENPLLSEQMHDLYNLLTVYDRYMSDDAGEEVVSEAWGRYRAKWLGTSSEELADHVFRLVKAETDAYIESIRPGFDGRERDFL